MNWSKRHGRTALVVVLFVTFPIVGYVTGAFTAVFKVAPYPTLLQPSFQAIAARNQRAEKLRNPYGTALWNPVHSAASGVVIHDPSRSFPGYTFFTQSDDTSALLMDTDGQVVHKWSLPFRKAWASAPHTNRPPPESHIYWRRAHLFPNGDVIAIYTTVADTPYGYGLVKVDKDSKLLWKYPAHTHHDFDVSENGAIFAIDQRFRDVTANPIDGMPQAPRMVLEDELVQLDADGREQKRVNLLDLLADSPYRHLLQMYAPGSGNPASDGEPGDLLHTNSINVVGEDFASHHDFVKPGQILVSFRPLDALALISMDDERVVWMTRGFWSAQHDPDPLEDGRILLFDNRGFGGPGGNTRVLEYDPSSHTIEWSYTGTENHPLSCKELGAQEKLPNGNVLITSSQQGQIIEVNRAGDIVWNYLNPVRHTHDGTDYTSSILEATRIRPDQLQFVPDGR